MCKSCLQTFPTAFEYYESRLHCEPKLTSIESKLSDLQSSVESQLSVTVRKIESQLNEYHKVMSTSLSKDLDPQSAPTSKKIDNSISQISKTFEACSTDYYSLLTKFETMAKTPPNVPAKDANAISSAVSSVINEEKEKSKRKLNLIVHNLPESSKDNGDDRKQEDISSVSGILDKYLGISVNIAKAFRLGQRRDKPRLLKVTVSTEQEKAGILRNCTKLRNSNNPNDIKNIFITPDLTPLEQTANRKLREELKEKNKDGNFFRIKQGRIVRRN